MAAEGTLLQLDGSQHDWLEERGPRLSLLGAIDDATGMVPAASISARFSSVWLATCPRLSPVTIALAFSSRASAQAMRCIMRR